MEEFDTKIYGIMNAKGDIVYVGKTTQELEKRFSQHKKDITHPEKMEYFNNVDNCCNIILLHSCFKAYAKAYEQEYINKYNPFLNRVRAKQLTQQEKYCQGKIALREAKKMIEEMKKNNVKK